MSGAVITFCQFTTRTELHFLFGYPQVKPFSFPSVVKFCVEECDF